MAITPPPPSVTGTCPAFASDADRPYHPGTTTMDPIRMNHTPRKCSVTRLPHNHSGRDFVVGDLHGQFDLLHGLLSAVSFDLSRDRLFSCGDLVDRGGCSAKVLALVTQPWFFPVCGNHEELLVEHAANGETRHGWMSSTDRGWASGLSVRTLESLSTMAASLPTIITVESPWGEPAFHVVHAEILPEFHGDVADDHYVASLHGRDDPYVRHGLLWGRRIWRGGVQPRPENVSDGLSIVYCGHSVVSEPCSMGGHRFMDTGAHLPDGKLSVAMPSESSWMSLSRDSRRTTGLFDAT